MHYPEDTLYRNMSNLHSKFTYFLAHIVLKYVLLKHVDCRICVHNLLIAM